MGAPHKRPPRPPPLAGACGTGGRAGRTREERRNRRARGPGGLREPTERGRCGRACRAGRTAAHWEASEEGRTRAIADRTRQAPRRRQVICDGGERKLDCDTRQEECDMSAVNNLLDKYREACSITSDSALADSLKISRQGVHQWRKGLSWPSEEHIITMANKIKEPAERWLASISMDRAPEPAKKYWMKLMQAAAAVAGAYLMLRNGLDVHAATALAPFACIHYAKLSAGIPADDPCADYASFTAGFGYSGAPINQWARHGIEQTATHCWSPGDATVLGRRVEPVAGTGEQR